MITKNLTFEYKRTSQLPRLFLFVGSLLALISLLLLQRKFKSRTPLRDSSASPKSVSALEDPAFLEWFDTLKTEIPPLDDAIPTTKRPVKRVVSKSTSIKKVSATKAKPKKAIAKKTSANRR